CLEYPQEQGNVLTVATALTEATATTRESRPGVSDGPRRRWRRPLLGIPFAALSASFGLVEGEPTRLIREGDQHEDVARRDAVFRRSLALADLVAAALALLVCVPLIGQEALEPAVLLALPLVVLAGKLIGIYDRDELLINKATIDEAPRLFEVATLNALL